MSTTQVPDLQSSKRVRSYSDSDIKAKSKLQKDSSTSTSELSSSIGSTSAKIAKDQDAITSIDSALSDTIQSKVQSAVEATITKIVEGVVSGLQSEVKRLVGEISLLREDNIDLKNRVSDLERQHDVDEKPHDKDKLPHGLRGNRVDGDKDPKDCAETSKLVQDKEHIGKDRCTKTEKDEAKGKQSSFHAICILDEKGEQATKNFVDKLKERLLYDFLIDLELTNTPYGSGPVIVLCNCNTRIGNAVEKALGTVKDVPYNRMVLVAFHLVREDHLPKIGLRSRLTDKDSYKDIAEMVDIGFDQNDIYKCDENISSMKTISDFVKTFKA